MKSAEDALTSEEVRREADSMKHLCTHGGAREGVMDDCRADGGNDGKGRHINGEW